MPGRQEKADEPPWDGGEMIHHNDRSRKKEGVAECQEEECDQAEDEFPREELDGLQSLNVKEAMPSLCVQHQAAQHLLKPRLKRGGVILIAVTRRRIHAC